MMMKPLLVLTISWLLSQCTAGSSVCSPGSRYHSNIKKTALPEHQNHWITILMTSNQPVVPKHFFTQRWWQYLPQYLCLTPYLFFWCQMPICFKGRPAKIFQFFIFDFLQPYSLGHIFHKHAPNVPQQPKNKSETWHIFNNAVIQFVNSLNW